MSILSFPRGVLEAMLEAIGDEVNELAGIRMTRARAAAAAGVAIVLVETTLDWATSGAVIINGQRYTYSGITPGSITGLSPVLVADVATLDVVYDVSRVFSAVDLARNMLLSDKSEAEYLDALAANYGIKRDPTVDDTTFRALIQVLAFSDKTTIYCIEKALAVLVGANNFTVFEDLINFPGVVFISLVNNGLALTAGRAYLNALDLENSGSTTAVNTADPPVGALSDSVVAVRLAPDAPHALFSVKPSVEPTTAWTYTGTQAENTHVTDNGDGSFKLVDDAATVGAEYERALRIDVESGFDVTFTLKKNAVTDTGGASTLELRSALTFRISDGTREIAVGVSNLSLVGFYNTATGAFIGSTAAWADGTKHTVRIAKPRRVRSAAATDAVDLFLDGVRVASVPYSSFNAAATHKAGFGSYSLKGASNSDWFDVNLTVHDGINYWNGYSAVNGSTNAASPARLSTATDLFVPAKDVAGRAVRLGNSTVKHGRANGRYRITAVDAGGAFVDVAGIIYTGADLIDVDRLRIPRDHENAFTAEDAGVQAALGTGAGNARITWTAKYGGDDGNAIDVQLINPGANNIPLSVVVAAVDSIQVTLRTGSAGAIASTASDVIAAVRANVNAAALVNVALTTGSDGTAFCAATGPTNLTGGEDGKKLTISGAVHGGNNAQRKIATLIDSRTVLLGSHLSPANLVTEDGVSWSKDPNFHTDVSLEWETQAAGLVVGTTLTLRRALPSSPLQLEIDYVLLPSGTVLRDEFTANPDAQHPLYLFDEFEFIRGTVKAILAAGIQPRFR